MYQEEKKETIQIDIASMHRDMKSAAIALIGAIVIALALTMGPAFITFLYFCTTLAGVIGYAMYPEHCDTFLKDKQLHLLGASVGFFVAGPLGLLLGAWLVHFTAQKLNVVARQAETVQSAGKKLISPLIYIKDFFVKAKDTAADVFDVLSQMEPNFNYPESDDDEIENEAEAKKDNNEDEEQQAYTSALEEERIETIQISKPSTIMSWLYKNIYILPPSIPTLPSTHTDLTNQEDMPGTPSNKR
tara:strand:+ start:20961 stop:21695 length:735 start_codon:yes stop_codon:yes gene_type:complete